MPNWISEYETLWWWIAGVSLVMIVASIIIAPAIVVAIPPDYFSGDRRPESKLADHHPVVRVTLKVLKNILGYIFLLAGLVMLALPGQGLITIALGIILIDFPGKYKFQRWLVCRKSVLKGINWLRRKRGHMPLKVHC